MRLALLDHRLHLKALFKEKKERIKTGKLA